MLKKIEGKKKSTITVRAEWMGLVTVMINVPLEDLKDHCHGGKSINVFPEFNSNLRVLNNQGSPKDN